MIYRGKKSDAHGSGRGKKLQFALEACANTLIDPGCIAHDLGYNTLRRMMMEMLSMYNDTQAPRWRFQTAQATELFPRHPNP
jgi:hypothetical protein